MKKCITCLLVVLSALTVTAQKNVIDQVVWIVGDEAILRSDVENQRLQMQYDNQDIEGDPYCVIPEQLAIQKLYLHQADLDSIEVSESTINNQVEMRMNYFLSQIGSKEKMEEYFHKSTDAIREEMHEMVANQMKIQQVQAKLTENISLTPGDVRKFYGSLTKDSVPTIPTEVEVQIISIAPPVPREESERIKATLRDFTDRINKGTASFSMLARLYSEDTESAKHGGELGFTGRGQLVPEFANVAFALTDPNKISRIVETEYGYHIIQLIERRGERGNFRHILLRPHISTADKEKALTLLDSIANVVREGKMTFEQAVAHYSEDKTSMMNAGVMTNEQTGASKFEYQDLPPEVAKQVYQMKVGEISDAFTMMDEANKKEVCAIVRLKSRTDTHKADLNNDYQVIKTALEEKRSGEILDEWIQKKIGETYISINPEWRNCNFQYKGWVK